LASVRAKYQEKVEGVNIYPDDVHKEQKNVVK
jgi:hypothetical protein